MIDVSEKKETLREAKAYGKISLSQELLKMIKDDQVPKGNVFEQSRLAAIMAAKKAPELIPLCHPLRITGVKIDFRFVDGGIEVESQVSAFDRTGVEIEALCAVTVACLNIYDMCKKFDRGMKIENVHLLEKSGGASGEWSACKEQ